MKAELPWQSCRATEKAGSAGFANQKRLRVKDGVFHPGVKGRISK